jgi:hypothetical protein
MTDEPTATQSERDALMLLPWFVNGTLEGEEREAVQRSLRSSLTVRLEHDRLVRLQAVMKSDDAEHAATDRGFERLMARIAANGVPVEARPVVSRRAWRPWPLAQAAAILALASGLAWWTLRDDAVAPGTYVTLTSEPPAGVQRPQLRLMFAPGVSEAERRALLAEYGLTQAAPTTPDGLYGLVVSESADARDIAERLRSDPRVAFVTTPPAAGAE